jgi:hypothetical protein
MTVNNIYGMQNNKAFMDTFAQALQQQINGRAFGGTLDLSGRPDLDIGKNVYHIERQKLLYIMGISHTIRQGQDRSTTLQLAYGHDISREIVSPFVSTRNINAGATASSGAVDSSNSSSGTTGTSAADITRLETAANIAAEAVLTAENDGSSQDVIDKLRQASQAATRAFADAQASNVVQQAPLISGGAGGPSLAGAVLNNPAAGVFDDAANDFVLPSSYTDPVVAGLAAAIRKAPNFALTVTNVVPTVPPIIITGKNGPQSIGIVNVDPNVLLQQAITNVRAKMNLPDFSMTLEEYTLARFLASEGGFTLEQTIIAQSLKVVGASTKPGPRGSTGIVALALKSNYKQANGFYGNQAGKHAATSKDPFFKHLLVAQAVLRSGAPHIIPNVLQFFNIKAFKSQPGVTRTAGRVGQDWTDPAKPNSRVWVGNIQSLGNSTTCFFRGQRRSGPVKDTEASRILARKKLLIKTGPVAF